MAGTREPEKKTRKGKSPNTVGGEILAALGKKLGLDDDVQPLLQDPTGRTFVYNGRFWEELSKHSFKALVYEHHPASRNSFREEVMHYLNAACHRRDHKWERVADHEVPCENGVVDVRTGKLRPHRPEDYLESIIPWPWDASADPSEALEAYLLSCFGELDVERPGALQEFAGYVLMAHARLKKAFFGQGPKDTGKSQYALLLKLMVGSDQACVLPVEAMDDPVRMAAIVGKRLNVLTELKSDAMIRDGGFKQLVSTEEPIEVNPKYVPSFAYTPICKHVIIANDLPQINDRTSATVERLLIVPFTRVIPKEEQDPDLQKKFAAEMPGILRWAVAGARRLIEQRGQFSKVELSEAKIQQIREESNALIGFLRQMAKKEEGAAIPLNDLVAAFNKWKGGGKAADVRQVGKLARAAFGDEATGVAWNPAAKSSASSLLGWRLRDVSEQPGEYAKTWQVGEAPADEA